MRTAKSKDMFGLLISWIKWRNHLHFLFGRSIVVTVRQLGLNLDEPRNQRKAVELTGARRSCRSQHRAIDLRFIGSGISRSSPTIYRLELLQDRGTRWGVLK